ncbi:MAG: hybrid sensor histidine kinase/response regulator [Holophagaceae bacterium]|nr:hybrid sensor histidine kinase/response regulator [Holophagaceae bacterium]
MLVPQSDILIVDDNPANLDLLSGLLREHAFHVRAVPSGRMALDAVRRSPPELVMLDITMPGMNGYETCQAMQQDPAISGIPVIFISALDDPLDKVKAFQAGGRDYVSKPFHAEEVIARVNHQVRMVRLEKALKIQNENLLDANLKLREMNMLKANFTAMLVHDIRSPMTVVGIALGAAQDDPDLFAVIHPQARSAYVKVQNLLEEMLEVYRSESGQMPFDFSTFAVLPWLDQIVSAYRPLATGAGLGFQVQIASDLPDVLGDASKLERALANLLTNAFKFTPRGGAVRLEAAVDHGAGVEAGLRWLRITITDTGRGIPAEELPFIFDPFRQARAQDSMRGVGLGLAIVQRIVAGHRGSISVNSQVGFGTTFTMKLPG